MSRHLHLHQFYVLFCFQLLFTSCSGQASNSSIGLIGGPCEGCEAAYEYGDMSLTSVDTTAGFYTEKPQIKIYGTIYQKDAKTPAKDVILYYYHTDTEGIYETIGSEKGWARRHGIHRGWVKTDADGKYAIYTFRPASYPGTTIPQHIHCTVLEPDKNPYFIDDVFFSDDPNLPQALRNPDGKRGGHGLVTLNEKNGIWEARRDIILGKHIPHYW